ncbi:MAG TPA: hypothetical protein VGX25_10660 [Actinophytocola sp.]|uniref:hypothetical protein n=1 Tax=Actinophytocola sp. TaxID=1872138 RepID=UPI002DDCDC97|nr:hypothetical protein [Actinophytocola sp.]HEV2779847.1 hypothetical protein [Actinophytocola sp.]
MRAQLAAALEESLQAAPDPAEVLRGVRRGIERRRRRRRNAGLATVLVIVAVTVVASVATWPAGPQPGARVIPVGDWPGTIELTWVPSGLVNHGVRSTVAGEDVYYGDSAGIGLRVFVDNVDRTRNLDEPGWQRTEINGRPGREVSRDVRTMIVFRLPSGRWAELELLRYSYERSNQPGLREDALRIAAGIRETTGRPQRIDFAPTYLPAGQRIIGLATSAQLPDGEGDIVCAAGSLQPKAPKEYLTEGRIVDHRRPADLGPGLRISFHRRDPRSAGMPVAAGADRIADIQGRPAYLYPGSRTRLVVDGVNGGVLVVDALLDGEAFTMARPDGLVPVAEMIKVAQGVRWTG